MPDLNNPPLVEVRARSSQGIDTPTHFKVASLAFDTMGIAVDFLELSLSAGELPVTELGTVAGSGTGPPGWAAVIFGRQILDSLETMVGATDIPLSIIGSWYSGQTYYDSNSNEIVFGQDAAMTLFEQIVDVGLPACPECDFASNVGSLVYDIGDLVESSIELAGGTTWNLFSSMEYRVPALTVNNEAGTAFHIPNPNHLLPRELPSGLPNGEGYFVVYTGLPIE